MLKIKKIVYLFSVISIMVTISCSKNLDGNLNQTGLLDQNGNLIKDTLIYTNEANFNGSIPKWAIDSKTDYTIITNIVNATNTNYQVIYGSNYYLPNLPPSATDYYRISVPWAGGDEDYYTTVSYKDVNKLNQLWFDQIFRRGAIDGKVFAIRNRDNDGGYWHDSKKSFQSPSTIKEDDSGREDYYYFDNNGDIIYKGGDKSYSRGETLMKEFVAAVIVDYRWVTQRTEDSLIKEADKIKNTGEWTVGAIYKMAIDVNEAREKFAGSGPSDGAYDFIAARKKIWFKYNLTEEDKTTFTRQYYTTDFIEVLVLNPHNNEGNTYCLGVDAYYAYYGDYRAKDEVVPVPGFSADNMHYMTDPYEYIAQRPEYIVPLLNHTTTFTDSSRNFKYLAMPGHKY